MSWAPYLMSSWPPSTVVCTERMSVNGGTTTTSTLPKSCFLSARPSASFCTRCTASWWLRFIFQLPAISGVRVALAMSSLGQYVDPRELFALEVFQAGATTGGDVTELVVSEPEPTHSCSRVPTADDGETLDVGERLGHCPSP